MNGSNYKMLQLRGKEGDAVMHIGYITKKNMRLSTIGCEYIEMLRKNI